MVLEAEGEETQADENIWILLLGETEKADEGAEKERITKPRRSDDANDNSLFAIFLCLLVGMINIELDLKQR